MIAVFSKKAFKIVDHLISGLDEKVWDILFLKVGTGDVKEMIELKMIRDAVVKKAEITLLNLSNLRWFFGALSYIVNHKIET
jgi:hypothetical protein